MLSVVIRVREGPKAKSREGRSWLAIAAEAWGTDILRERSFLWLVGSRLAILMAGSVLTQLATPYLARSMGLDQKRHRPRDHRAHRAGRPRDAHRGRAVGPHLRSGRSQARDLGELRPGRPWASRSAPSRRACRSPISGPLMYGISAGIFLAVDWALMTDIIPKASSGRYMGLSNVATASAGVLAVAIGGIDHRPRRRRQTGRGPRCGSRVGLMVLGALLLRPVVRAPARGLRSAPSRPSAVSPGAAG